jgi:hypothetical protein
MLESLVYPALLVADNCRSENASGADNQQERPSREQNLSGRDIAIRNPQRLYAEHGLGKEREDIVRAAWRHAEPGRNDLAASEAEVQNAEAEKRWK